MASNQRSGRYWFRGYLPHIEVPGAPLFVTWTLIDAVPAALRLRARLAADAGDTPDQKRLMYRRLIERTADRGLGSSLLRRPANASVVASTLRFWDGARYSLHAWCVMPNHVHVVLTLAQGYRLDDLVESWKKYSSRRIERPASMGPHLWHREYFDRYARSDRDTSRWVRYVATNPERAGLINWPWSYPRV